MGVKYDHFKRLIILTSDNWWLSGFHCIFNSFNAWYGYLGCSKSNIGFAKRIETDLELHRRACKYLRNTVYARNAVKDDNSNLICETISLLTFL